MPLLLLLLFGIIDFGRMLNAQITVTEAAREGARAASLNASRPSVRTRVYTVMGGSAGVTVNQVRCGNTPSATADAQVTVRYRFEFVTPVAVLAGIVSGPVNLSATGVMPCRA